MKILDRYLVKGLIGYFLAVILGFSFIMAANQLFFSTDLFIYKGTPLAVVLRWLILKLPAILVLAFPVSMLFATLLSLSRLAKDGEITAMRSGKISFYRIMLPFLLTGIMVSLLAYLTNEKIVPFTNHLSENIIRRLILSQSLPIIQENAFFKGGENRYFYVRRYNKEASLLEGVMIYELSSGEFPQVLTAKRARWEKDSWHLKEGVIHKYDRDGYIDYEAKFKDLKIHIDFNPTDFFGNQRTPQEMSRKELLKQIKIFKRGGIDTKSLSTDLHFKISIPFACLIVVLISAPLSLRSAQGGALAAILFSVTLVSAYYVLMSVSYTFGKNGLLPPVVAAWSQNAIFGITGLYLVWKAEH